jgi:Fe-S cluster assembly protein SufB
MEDLQDNILSDYTQSDYKFGFVTNIETETIAKGLNEDVVRLISGKKQEPEFMLEFRLKAYRHWLTMKMPEWAHLRIPKIDYQEIIYYAAPKQRPKLAGLDEVDPELLRTFDKLGIPLEEQKMLAGVAVDAVMDSISVKTTFKETLAELGVIFCSMSEAVREYPDLVKNILGRLCHIPIISLHLLTQPFSATVHSAISPKV